jgi:predicted transcriptional regulator
MKATALAKEADVSRQHIYRLSYGLVEPTLEMMVKLRTTCSRLLSRRVRMSELFAFGEC